MVFGLSALHPRGKESEFPVVSIVRKPHLGSYKENFAIEDYDTAVVNYVFMDDWHSNIAYDTLRL